jgi:hypothetical protein
MYEFSGALEAYIKYYDAKSKSWKRMKKIPIYTNAMNTTCYKPHSNKYVAKVKRVFPLEYLVKYVLVIKDKNFVILSQVVKANNTEDTGISLFDSSYYK